MIKKENELSTQGKGIIGLLRATEFFIKRGSQVYLPISDYGQADMIVVESEKPYKIQCRYIGERAGKPTSSRQVINTYTYSTTFSARLTENTYDFLWVSTPDGDFLFPWRLVIQHCSPNVLTKSNRFSFSIRLRDKESLKYLTSNLRGSLAELKDKVD